MKKTLIFALLSSFTLSLSPAFSMHGFGQKSKVQIPEIDFVGGITLPITKTCIEDGHVRAKKEFQPRHNPLVRPILQVVKYRMGFERSFHLVHRINTRGQLIQTFDMSTPEGRLISQNFFDIPHCSEKLISTKHELFVEKIPTPQEMMVLAALFQKGITHAETQNYLIPSPNFNHLPSVYHEMNQVIPSRIDVKIHSHQCRDGLIELTPEFLKYLETPNGQRNYPAIEEALRTQQEYAEKYYNRIWNNHLRNRSLYQIIGGEGSGSGRVGFGLALGGEGSGSGRRRLEDLSTNALALEKGGEIEVSVHMDPYQFYGLNYNLNMLQRLFNINKEYQPYLNGGAPIPSKLVSVECGR